MSSTILIIEDDRDINELLRYNLEKSDFTVIAALDGEEGLALARSNLPALILLDWLLPGLSGIELCRQLRESAETRRIPVIMLTSKGEETDKVSGLDVGADDYITKPFSPAELTARIKAVLRRTSSMKGGAPAVVQPIRRGPLYIDPARHRVLNNDVEVKLGPTEFRLLHHFMQFPGEVFSRERLLELVWEKDIFVELRTVDVHIRRLRKALEEDGDSGFIRTVRSAGYAFDVRSTPRSEDPQ